MTTIDLHTATGRAVEQAQIPDPGPSDWPPLVAWGSRFFVRGADGRYREVACLQVYTGREHAAMGGAP